MEAATAERSSSAGLDADEVKKQAAEIAGGEPEDDGLGGPHDTRPGPLVDDPNSEANTGVPGGRQPGDDGYVPPLPEATPPTDDLPPTPAADLPVGDSKAEEEQEAPQLFLTGSKSIGVKVGGRKPDSSVLKYKAGKLELGKSQFDREDRFLTVDVWQVTGDNDQDTINKVSGEVRSTSKAQSATLCGTTRLEEWLAAKIEDRKLLEEVCGALDLDFPAES